MKDLKILESRLSRLLDIQYSAYLSDDLINELHNTYKTCYYLPDDGPRHIYYEFRSYGKDRYSIGTIRAEELPKTLSNDQINIGKRFGEAYRKDIRLNNIINKAITSFTKTIKRNPVSETYIMSATKLYIIDCGKIKKIIKIDEIEKIN